MGHKDEQAAFLCVERYCDSKNPPHAQKKSVHLSCSTATVLSIPPCCIRAVSTHVLYADMYYHVYHK